MIKKKWDLFDSFQFSNPQLPNKVVEVEIDKNEDE